MRPRAYLLFLLPLSVFLHLIVFSAKAQTVKVEGYAIMSSVYITQFDGQYFSLQKKDGLAIVDLSGRVLVSGLKAPSIGFFSNNKISLYKGVFFCNVGTDIVLKNLNGQTLGTGKYSDAQLFVTDNTAARVRSPQGTWFVAYLDTTGKEIVRFDVKKYLAIADPISKIGGYTFITLDDFLPFSEGLTPIKSKVSKKYGYINKNLQLAIPVSFAAARPFSEGLASVENADGYWGFIDAKGKAVIPFTYTNAPGRFSSGLAKVQNKEGKYGYINKGNQVLIAPRFVEASTFYKGYALAKEGYSSPAVLIDSMGSIVATFPKLTLYIDNSSPGPGISGEERFEYPFYISETLRQLVDEGEGIFSSGLSYGVVDNKGKVVLDFKYKYLSDLHNGKMFGHIVNNGNHTTPYQVGILDDKGEWLVQFVTTDF